MLLYVDDILIASSTEFIQMTLAALKAQWLMTETGIISRDGVLPKNPVSEVMLLGCRVAVKDDNAISFDQSHYIQEKLYERGYAGVHGSPNLPESLDTQVEPVDKDQRSNPDFRDDRKKCQEETGVLVWIAQRTRPDIAAATSMVASLSAYNPAEAFIMIAGIWRYLAHTYNLQLIYGRRNETGCRIVTDASFAPAGDRSRTGVVIFWKGGTIFWHTKRQGMATLSTAEAELGAGVPGLKYGLAIHNFLMDVEPNPSKQNSQIYLKGDNMATILTLLHAVTSWRTRHYAVKAAWARDIIKIKGIHVEHIPGEFLVADILTKILRGSKQFELREELNLCAQA